jgi:hypothetical protein
MYKISRIFIIITVKPIITIYSFALEELKLHVLNMRRHYPETVFLIQLCLRPKFCPSVLEMIVFEYLLGTSETSLCSMSAPQVKIVNLLDAYMQGSQNCYP